MRLPRLRILPHFLSFIVLFFNTIHNANCLIVKGTKSVDKNWMYLAKFCFISLESRIEFKVSYPASYKFQVMTIYYDDQWEKVYPKKDMACQSKLEQASKLQRVELNPASKYIGIICEDKNDTIECLSSESIALESSRARYWFISISNCDSDKVQINYDLTFTNGEKLFRKHFSADEFGIFETSIAFTIVYFFLFLLTCAYAKILYNKKFFHLTFKLFLVSVIVQFVSFLFFMAEYAQFAHSGQFTPGMLTTARVFDAIAQIVFLLMLILVAKGYTITRGRLRKITTIKLIIFFIIYTLAYSLAFIFAEALFDEGLVNYFLKSPAGITIICLKLILGWTWFVYSIIFTLKNYPEKRKFYIVLLVFFSIWFWIGPLLTLLCSFLVEDHIRQFVAFVVQSFIVFAGHAYILVLTRPTSENKTFPYHVKTTQIGIIVDRNSAKENFPHHIEDKAGNIAFEDTNYLQELFVIKTNSAEKYQMEDVTKPSEIMGEEEVIHETEKQ